MSELKREMVEAGLRIGAVAKLTGLSVHTLRKWEDRYHAVSPTRSEGGERLYAQEDVKRLRLMRTLSGAGMSLRELAALDLETLEATLERVARDAPAGAVRVGSPRVARVAAFGATAPELLRELGSQFVEVVATGANLTELAQRVRGVDVDVCVCELSTVTADTRGRVEDALERTGARAVVVAYAYGARTTVDALRRRGLALLRAPLDPDALERAVLDAFEDVATPMSWSPPAQSREERDPPPAPAFTVEAIARVAQSSPAIRCECPRHIADLLYGLRAFEEYSADCESRSPEDAALHRYLWETAGHARALFEEALARVAKAEGIELD